ncbi:hypothetical protein QQF73_00560 [Marinobacter sp. M216]|uniref:DUF2489 domain-containing protein n=1 Tax=Marinobacter albus TaxID=3030833 RepID=A0ABT7H6X3_9GAMM|nr:hypothetical protein [Marinobacter sp. M216]MDK9556095.1 hypothetical protein [Marinobacter sp. M216]
MSIAELKQLAPVLSLIVAGLAVFVGPFVSWRVAQRQSDTSLRVANKQVIAPMRQAWINSLRDLVSELLGKCAHYWASGYEDREDSEYQHITELVHRLELHINPREQDHAELVTNARAMEGALGQASREADKKFWNAHQEIRRLAQDILKREWDRTKTEI